MDEALRLNGKGYWVVPCKGKKPIKPGWGDTPLTSAELKSALAKAGTNIAIALHRTDLIDVECDTQEAEAALQELFGGRVPPTPTWRSKRGLHRLFRRPAGLPEKAKVELDGIEFRIANGRSALSIVPPSVHPDGVGYEWEPGLSLDDVEPADLPAEVTARLAQPDPASSSSGSGDGDVPEGERNDTLFKLACRLFDAGLTEAAVEVALQTDNAARCKPPLPAPEVTGIVKSAVRDRSQSKPKPSTKNGEPKHAEAILNLADTGEYWHTPDDVAFVTIPRDGHREHWPVRSRAFKTWLGAEYYRRTGKAAGSATLQDVVNALEGRAKFGGPCHPTAVRVGGHDGNIYVDLADDEWRAVEVDAAGWRLVSDPPVRFRRTKAMLPLPVPQSGGDVRDLRRFVNVGDEHWPLVLAWLVAAYRPRGPYPVLKLLAEQGSGKTTAARVQRSLTDPNSAPVRSAPRGERDLMIAATNGWVVCLDNLSFVDGDLSDALCRLATGGAVSVRTLYADDEETIFVAQRPALLNGIEDIGFRSDLLDRSLVVELPRIEPKNRRPEKVFWREFEEARPLILGALLDAVSAAVRNLPAVERSDREWPRMADFAQWAVAAEPALRLGEGEFLAAYEANRESAGETTLESSAVVVSLREALRSRKGVFEGTATALLGLLSIGVDERRVKGWPQNARALSGQLNRLAPNLRAAGWTLDQFKRNNQKLIRITAPSASAPTQRSQTSGTAPCVSTQAGTSASPQSTQKVADTPVKPQGGLAARLQQLLPQPPTDTAEPS